MRDTVSAAIDETRHLIRRFVASYRTTAPDDADEAMLVALLSPGEVALYRAQPAVDRAHSVACALAIRADPSVRPTRDLMVASALHDVGKADTDLGSVGRALATVAGVLLGRRRTGAWVERSGIVGRLARYRHHDERGARLLEEAGSAALVVAWAREHHMAVGGGTIEAALGNALRRADESAV